MPSEQINDAYRNNGQFGNLNNVTKDRVQRIIDQADGQDCDLDKIKRQFAKNKWDFDGNGGGGPSPADIRA